MKAIFGKMSIGCFIALWILIGQVWLLSYLVPPKLMNVSVYGGLFAVIVILLSLQLSFWGFLFAIIGMTKESPKVYAIIGLLLNLGTVPFILHLIGIK
jgi:hypothetical protein